MRSKASSRSARRALSLRPLGHLDQDQVRERQEFVVGGYSPVDRAAARDRRAGRRLLRRRPARLCRPRRHRLSPRPWRATCGSGCIALGDRQAPPFDQIRPTEDRRRDVVWVEPKMVIEASSAAGPRTAWCARRRSRACARTSRRGRSCGSCRLAAAEESGCTADPHEDRCRDGAGMTKTSKTARVGRAAHRRGGRARSRGGRKDVRFTHPDRVYWADVGVTKQDSRRLLRSVWDWMAPACRRPAARAAALSGRHAGECFFQKHASAGLRREISAP